MAHVRKLIHEQTGKEIHRGDELTHFRTREKYVLESYSPDRNRVYASWQGHSGQEFFPQVFNCNLVDYDE